MSPRFNLNLFMIEFVDETITILTKAVFVLLWLFQLIPRALPSPTCLL